MLFGSSLKRKVKSKRYKPSNSTTEFLDYRGQTTVVVDEFDYDIFKRVLEYAHTGYITIQARTLLGIVNAADHFQMPDLVEACMNFLSEAISPDNVCSMLSHAEKYTRYFQTDSARLAMHKILEFVDQHAEEVLGLRCLSTVPKQVMMLVLDREESSAGESVKFEAALRWCKLHQRNHPNIPLKTIFEPFARLIEFHRIPATDLMHKVKPSDVVEERVIVNALAYQSDPSSVDPASINSRALRALSCGNYRIGQDPSISLNNRSTSLTNLGHRVDLAVIREDSSSNLSQVSQYSQSHGAIDSVVYRVEIGYSSCAASSSSLLEARSVSEAAYHATSRDVFESESEVDEVCQGTPQQTRNMSPQPPLPRQTRNMSPQPPLSQQARNMPPQPPLSQQARNMSPQPPLPREARNMSPQPPLPRQVRNMSPQPPVATRTSASSARVGGRGYIPLADAQHSSPMFQSIPPPIQRTCSDQPSSNVKQGFLMLSKPRRYTATTSKENLSQDFCGSVGTLSQVSSTEC